MTKHLALLGHRMTRIFPILLFIGLAWGQESWREDFLKEFGGFKYSPNSKKPYTGNSHLYHKDGRIKSEGKYRNGLKDGKWMYYDSMDNVQSAFYKKGELVDEKHFDKQGNTILAKNENYDYLEITNLESFLSGKWKVIMELTRDGWEKQEENKRNQLSFNNGTISSFGESFKFIVEPKLPNFINIIVPGDKSFYFHFRPDSIGGSLIALIEGTELDKINLEKLYKNRGDLLYAIRNGYAYSEDNFINYNFNNGALKRIQTPEQTEEVVLSQIQYIKEILPEIADVMQDYFLLSGEKIDDIEVFERMGKLDIERSIKLFWHFNIDWGERIIAQSTEEIPRDIEKWVIYDINSGVIEVIDYRY